jgi:hypothetical protein
MEVNKIRQGAHKKVTENGDEDSDNETKNFYQLDEKEREEFDNLDEDSKIKFNLRNSSKVYYNITHSI